ncbi:MULTISPECIES: EscU/YscU/HrcU family type III secretion system export apparatus switch protein [Chromobacterium]|uniref:EscU/YscU/HrcU family type III secretion system export apparatus switch protein n=3 Tax=Chromobacterium TaxID=535 RepID=A0A1W0D5C0_9NEIS|nr:MULTISPECIES: EscU/YscU/HrcU family type III secretion system export apparatus switch protein [Chromobacterium]AXT47987.1 flagellar biosynthesis protein FlhB [Chromobacterium rhizoryzae]KMN81921.1 flagellar biosynthesis protein FlhB [Chromobacterium sp. LK11]MBK0415050.1 EscU/YscU/HrcU family type III secretion system export apparatus switch protein [Chromobacterium haemolyticum]MBN3002831.1 EscU/YscU/HrcU family type III secretion system export apparatus switch protein [Chromobacterium alka
MARPPSEDKRRSAVALSYQEGHRSPKVVAKGYGELAERIIDRAREAGVFVHDSPELVSLLMQVDLDKNIPPELYRAVAEVLAFVYFLEHHASGKDYEFEAWLGGRKPAPLPEP